MTFDYQFIANPGYKHERARKRRPFPPRARRDRGPVSVIGTRVRAQSSPAAAWPSVTRRDHDCSSPKS
jgi:hypothetical protein